MGSNYHRVVGVTVLALVRALTNPGRRSPGSSRTAWCRAISLLVHPPVGRCGMRVQRLLQDSGDVGWVCSKLCATLLRPLGGCLFLSAFSRLDVALAAPGRGGQPLTAQHRDGVTLCYAAPSRGHTGSRAGSRQVQPSGGRRLLVGVRSRSVDVDHIGALYHHLPGRDVH